MILKLDPSPGDDLKSACRQACLVSAIIQIPVKFEFLGVEIYVTPASTVDSLLQQFSEKIKEQILNPNILWKGEPLE